MINYLNSSYLIIFMFIIESTLRFANAAQIIQTQNDDLCGALGDCLSISVDCKEKCGCDTSIPYIYNDETGECMLDVALLTKDMNEKYNTEEKIRKEAEVTFQGILFSCFFFITCASICALSACFYCCRINYSDHILKSDLDALKAKVERIGGLNVKCLKKPSDGAKERLQPIAESCNVVVEDAGVFVC